MIEPMQLALFDLDHTLIPFDTGMAWTDFLIGQGVLDDTARQTYLDHCHQYVAGTLDLHAMHRSSVGPLRHVPPPRLAGWLDTFRDQLQTRLPAATRALVASHHQRGDLCAIVTATPRFLARPLAELFGVPHLLATGSATDAAGHLTGEIDGPPCFRAHKIEHVQRWLDGLGHGLASFERSWFYSDSASDLPLLQAVSHPVAVRPDARLRAHALAHGWPVLEPAPDA
ncbi:HAD superfamily hydrolase (TIGR01490 family) [Sphaerotilus hippei]|uniref:HAD superfamily hydrolase (TIGR01490 family) n=2 Tax=Sphaerotilus hippei TaxID=744406 RepID=A0A318GUP7_9BURK|nr:HAD superfamily hydrolase (TIGR01490 family) [Sphaerotilus hippei]